MENTKNKPLWAVNAEKIMKSKGIQKNELLEIFNVSTSAAVGHYFQGRREPSIQGLINLSKKLKVSLSSLVGLKEEVKTNIGTITPQRLKEVFQLLVRCVDITPDEAVNFFKVYEKIGSSNIIESINIMSESDNDESVFHSILKVQDFMDLELKKMN